MLGGLESVFTMRSDNPLRVLLTGGAGFLGQRIISEVNLDGTRHLLEAARRNEIRAPVYTGTMDAVMDGGPLPDVNEDQPYPPHFMDAYSQSKALAEQAVLGGDDENLRTVVLRACGMYGEADQRADHFFEFMRKFVERMGHEFPPASRTIPAWAAMLAGRANEGFAKLVQPLWKLRPVLTKSSVSVLTNSISIKSTRLADDLGYEPEFGRRSDRVRPESRA
jgi:hypothetical protein